MRNCTPLVYPKREGKGNEEPGVGLRTSDVRRRQTSTQPMVDTLGRRKAIP